MVCFLFFLYADTNVVLFKGKERFRGNGRGSAVWDVRGTPWTELSAVFSAWSFASIFIFLSCRLLFAYECMTSVGGIVTARHTVAR